MCLECFEKKTLRAFSVSNVQMHESQRPVLLEVTTRTTFPCKRGIEVRARDPRYVKGMDDILFSGNLLVRVAGETETARESKIAPKSLQNKCKTWQKAWQKKKKRKKKKKKRKKEKKRFTFASSFSSDIFSPMITFKRARHARNVTKKDGSSRMTLRGKRRSWGERQRAAFV